MLQKAVRSARPVESVRNPRIAPVADAVVVCSDSVVDLLAALHAKRAAVKFGASKALRIMSEEQPKLLYPHFGTLAAMLNHDNQILKWNAMLTLANLAQVDSERKLETILDHYLDAICGPELITAANAIRGAATIAAAQPHLLARIVPRIMQVEHAGFDSPECRGVAIGHALQALDKLAPLLLDLRSARLFAARQLGNPRVSTSAKARKFLKTHFATASPR